jgi:hypothetical protein
MTNFTLGTNKYDNVIDTLSACPEFLASKELGELSGTGDDLPGVVAAAYARFIKRMLDDEQPFTKFFEPLNTMAAWDDNRVNELLETEVFEELFDSEHGESIAREMHGALKQMYLRWLRRWL